MRIAATILIALLALAAQPEELPPGHPPINQLPPGHPPVTTAPAEAPSGPAPAADQADTWSTDAIVEAYYASMSGPPDAQRDWDRFRSLFAPGSRLVTVLDGGGPLAMTPDQFVQINGRYFQANGYVERSVHEQVQSFGGIAQVLSTYESLRRGEAEPYSRGVTSFQLVYSDGRWWIVGVLWDRERQGVTIPAEWMPE